LIQNLESLSLFEPTIQIIKEEQENSIGMCIPDDVQVHQPNGICSKCKKNIRAWRQKKKEDILLHGNAQHAKLLV
jgi:predicted amidophosphoribosyltransferase